MYESWDEMTFGDMPDLSHRNPYVYAELLKLARWLIEEVGFDGFRYDFVKGYGANTIAAFQEYRYMRNGELIVPYGVAEFWDTARTIDCTGWRWQTSPIRIRWMRSISLCVKCSRRYAINMVSA